VNRVLIIALLVGCTEYTLDNKNDNEGVDTADPVVETTTTPPTTPTTPTTTPTYTDPPIETGDTAVTTTTTTTPIAEALVYANTRDTLYEVVPDTGATLRIGQFMDDAGTVIDNMIDIAIDPSGRMFGGTYEVLYKIDPTTAGVTKVCDIDVAMFALAFDDVGNLYAGGDNLIERIDIDACTRAVLVDHPEYITSGDLVGLPDGFLYWTIRGEVADELVKVSPRSGSTEWVGVVGVDRLFGLGYSDGSLYGFSDDREIVRIDPISAATFVLVPSSEQWWGATTNPVAW
jgi:hypothetical protein